MEIMRGYSSWRWSAGGGSAIGTQKAIVSLLCMTHCRSSQTARMIGIIFCSTISKSTACWEIYILFIYVVVKDGFKRFRKLPCTHLDDDFDFRASSAAARFRKEQPLDTAPDEAAALGTSSSAFCFSSRSSFENPWLWECCGLENSRLIRLVFSVEQWSTTLSQTNSSERWPCRSSFLQCCCILLFRNVVGLVSFDRPCI